MSDFVTQIYLTRYYPGLATASTKSEIVETIDPEVVEFDDGCYAFQYFEMQSVTAPNGEILKGKTLPKSGMHYRGEVMSLTEVKIKFPSATVLHQNMESNGWDSVCRTTLGNFQPFFEEDTLVKHQPFPSVIIPDANGQIRLPQ